MWTWLVYVCGTPSPLPPSLLQPVDRAVGPDRSDRKSDGRGWRAENEFQESATRKDGSGEERATGNRRTGGRDVLWYDFLLI